MIYGISKGHSWGFEVETAIPGYPVTRVLAITRGVPIYDE